MTRTKWETADVNLLTEAIIGSAIEVHRALGPGLLESAYKPCLAEELRARQLFVEVEKQLGLKYRTLTLDTAYRMDLVVEHRVIVEVKCVKKLDAVHEAQLLTYMKLAGCEAGLLLNFFVPQMILGVRRLVLKT